MITLIRKFLLDYLNRLVIAERRLSFGWAKGRPADADASSADCWFCLASPSLKVLKFQHRFEACFF